MEFASAKPQADKEVVIEAAKQDGGILSYAAAELKTIGTSWPHAGSGEA